MSNGLSTKAITKLTAAACGVVLVGIALVGSESALAAGRPASERCYDDVYAEYGENCDGWVFQVINKTDLEFRPSESQYCSRKPYSQLSIPAYAGRKDDGTYDYVEVARGEDALWMGPAGAGLAFQSPGGKDTVDVCLGFDHLGLTGGSARIELSFAEGSSWKDFDKRLPVRFILSYRE